MMQRAGRRANAAAGLMLVISSLHYAGGTAAVNASSQRRLQAGPRMLTLPFPNPELCSPEECDLFMPASAFPPEMAAHESREQFEQLKIRYTEVVSAIQRQQGSLSAKPTLQAFVTYARGVAHDSAATFDPPDSNGNWACDLNQLQAKIRQLPPGAPAACITWMQIFKVFMFYEAQVDWQTVALDGAFNWGSWCATSDNLPEGRGCLVPGTCWTECALALQTAQPGLKPEWCSPWPGCSAYDPPFGGSYAGGDVRTTVTTTMMIMLLLCGMCVMFALMKARAHIMRRGGKRYQKVNAMDGVELAVDFGDDETEDYAGKAKVVPTSG